MPVYTELIITDVGNGVRSIGLPDCPYRAAFHREGNVTRLIIWPQ